MRDREDLANGQPAQLRLNIGVTAHRDLVERDVPRMRAEVRGFLLQLQASLPDLPLQLICALASGDARRRSRASCRKKRSLCARSN